MRSETGEALSLSVPRAEQTELMNEAAKDALYPKSNLCIPGKGIARPQSQFLHLCVCERFMNSQDWSTYLITAKYVDRSCEYINLSQIYECRNWDTEHYNSVLEITRLHSFISVNTKMGTSHLYWILTGPSYAVWEKKFLISYT